MSWHITQATDGSWTVSDGTRFIEGFTRGHAQSVCEAMNQRDLRMALSLSHQLAVMA